MSNATLNICWPGGAALTDCPLCDPGCGHSDFKTCKGLRDYLLKHTQVSHGPSAKHVQKGWERMHQVRQRNGTISGVRRIPGIPRCAIDFARDQISGTLLTRVLKYGVDMKGRFGSGPLFMPANHSEFRAIFGHVPPNDPGITIKPLQARSEGRITVTITA